MQDSFVYDNGATGHETLEHHSPSAGTASADIFEDAASAEAQLFAFSAREIEARAVFVFTGMGPQWDAVGCGLLAAEPVFRKAAEKADAAFASYSGWSMLARMNAGPEISPTDISPMDFKEFAQPMNFILQVGLNALWHSWGIEPAAIVGHSVGEITAAHVAGALDLEDAACIIHHVSRIGRLVPPGRMLAARMTPEAAEALLESQKEQKEVVSVAAINSPCSVVLAGSPDLLGAINEKLKSKSVLCRWLPIRLAFHSSHMEFLKQEAIEALDGLRPVAPATPLYSTVTGECVRGAVHTTEYWWNNLRCPVNFAAAMDRMINHGLHLYLENSPKPVLASSIRECGDHRGVQTEVLAALSRGRPDRAAILEALGTFYRRDHPTDWENLRSADSRHGHPSESHRLTQAILADAAPSADTTEMPATTPFLLQVPQPGALRKIRFLETDRCAPGPGEVELRIEGVALNFKDALKMMGWLPSSVQENTFFGTAIGMEAAATVMRVGSGVEELRAGDEIIAMPRGGCMRSHVNVPLGDLFWVPRLSEYPLLRQAGMPIIFITSYYGLHEVARLQPGEKVLLHCATGGVGLAAIQVARWIGAEIFATAGSPEKRDYLRSLGIRHVMDSRSLDFADEIMEATGGRGVDVVLNFLSGEALEKSISVLAPFGRLIELGKRDMNENNALPLRAFNQGLTFAAVDIDRLALLHPDRLRRLLRAVWREAEHGRFQPVPSQVIPIQRIADATRLMLKAKHTGKIVLGMHDQTLPIEPLRKTVQLFRDDAY